MIKYYMFCIRWLWKNRKWDNTRQKFKAMEKDYARKNKHSLKQDYFNRKELKAMIKAEISRENINVKIIGDWNEVVVETFIFIDNLLEAVPDYQKSMTYNVLSSYLRDKSTGKIDAIENALLDLL